MSGPISQTSGGLDQFQGGLDAGVVEAIRSWSDDPELGKLYDTLQAIRDREPFLDTYAEAMVARHLLSRDCRLQVEVLTPSGRSCDFEVDRGGRRFYLHVKHLNTDRPVRKRLTVSSRLRYLERIARPYVVSVHLRGDLDDESMQTFVTSSAAFIQRAQIGDELLVRDDNDVELGGCRVVAPWQGDRVIVVLGLPTGFVDEAPRIRRLMRKAYQQFMPGATNVILICSSHVEDAEDFATALLGSHIERWDAQPPRGRRVAHGRDADGFWNGKRAPGSFAAGWFHFRPETAALECRLWLRREASIDPDVKQLLVDLFNGSSNSH